MSEPEIQLPSPILDAAFRERTAPEPDGDPYTAAMGQWAHSYARWQVLQALSLVRETHDGVKIRDEELAAEDTWAAADEEFDRVVKEWGESSQLAQQVRLHDAAVTVLAGMVARLMAPRLWTIHDVAKAIGASSSASARRTLGRWGVKPVGREPGRAGQSLYQPEDVRRAFAARPGRGARTDRHD
ncbi:hypothetical protein [Streptomyces sp. G-5]|uniref:hypothetical protein n=1 Tax=Streptomyces sp. G-5 TaxID=2977231 RepID=UPI0021CFFA30|nr:hypothetical protein [Streptomyces sp. G-5]MCU4750228.1 hypothetical protein [Streptomyces sp. G-5]